MKRIVILGVTGSIGTTALRGLEAFRDKAVICGVSCHSNIEKALSICREYSIKNLCVTGNIPVGDYDGIRVFKDISQMLEFCEPDIVLNGIASSEGLDASVKVIKTGTTLALANKESVVMGGKLLFLEAEKYNSLIIPVDSEHSAIDELIKVHGKSNVSDLIITASGGPFLRKNLNELDDITPNQAVKHPTWNMGPKISIDSSTLANKGLEVIEAHYLFGFDADHIEVTIHPQSVVHSMVRTVSGQVYSQMSPPDMVFPIMRALLRNEINKPVGKPLDFSSLNLTFEKLDFNRFPFVADAYECVRKEGVYPTVFNVANEIAVQAFCQNRIKYTDIQKTVHSALQIDWKTKLTSLEDVQILTKEIKNRLLIK